MAEVSGTPDVLCSVFSDHLAFLRRRGQDPAAFLPVLLQRMGLAADTPESYFSGSRRRVSWQTFAHFLDAWSELSGGPAGEAVFAAFILAKQPKFLQTARCLGSQVLTPTQMLLLGYPTAQRLLYKNLQASCQVGASGQVELILRQRPGDAPNAVFYRLVGHCLKAATQLGDFPAALMACETTADQGRYVMTPPPQLPRARRAYQWMQAVLHPQALREDLRSHSSGLADTYAKLTADRTAAEQALRDRLHDLEAKNEALQAEVAILRSAEHAASQRKEHELSLIRAKEQAEQASRTKTAFLSSMSHEIRTPMTSVLGFAELLSHDEVSTEKRQNYVEKILRNSRHLLALIDNILDLSKIEAGHLVPHCLRFSPATELAQGIDLIRDQAEGKGLSLTLECLEPFPQTMVSDQLRFRQILINLLGNAVKYTDHGGITVIASLRPDADRGMLEVHVQDTGLGIQPAMQANLFQPFSQITISGTRIRPGTGLGLALARNIARSLGGDVFLAGSSEGKGSTFTVMLPLDLPSVAKTPHAGHEPP